MICGGGGPQTGAKQVVIDNFLDVIALASLGLHETIIVKLFSRIYKLRISKQTISEAIRSSEFESFNGLQEVFLKPVIWKMMTDS